MWCRPSSFSVGPVGRLVGVTAGATGSGLGVVGIIVGLGKIVDGVLNNDSSNDGQDATDEDPAAWMDADVRAKVPER
jgi:endonuclease V-like protein UPF0215 family